MPYFNPHSFRSTLVTLGEKVCPSPEAFKAWSQNLGHSHVLTTFTSYGTVASSRQAEILEALRTSTDTVGGEPDQATIERVVDHLVKKVIPGEPKCLELGAKLGTTADNLQIVELFQ